MPPLRKLSVWVVVFTVLNDLAVVESFQSPNIRRVTVGRQHQRLSSQHASPSPSSTTTSHHDPKTKIQQSASSLHLSSAQPYDQKNEQQTDPLILRASLTLRKVSWFSWWSQVILTVVSSVTFLFARNVMDAQALSNPFELGRIASKFMLPGLGIVASCISIIWTWGARRLSRRFVRRVSTGRVEAANLLRRVIHVGATINLIGLLTSVLGAQYIVGTLVAKSMSSFAGFGGVGGIGLGGLASSQTLQPLDVLVVQANTNVLSSHFVSLACLLWLSRQVDLLDPPSLEDEV
mmetsp:Transcript_19691/g.30918  ORF Transcript_19691/g.30918 Transcript_19691/m.30918 type:complete len:291 (-) Transcript_19691:213-1085(-)|eukprot:CAMPEP_0201603358 /NCGR_PEP_ID=MMETSP0492-20130828/3821_1 /ASSEMBLY_ACC=CAM_ASM_000837 /TAXON_ID=420259 /ORGANISM="Thalassiosira gravida, Strain GMp14c1" /LENGTH=290 /DNA_ID=CAMNT_0048067111 /DNA_START=90 /DNA_END=962 /DNA_ORIENTATION=+